MGGLAGVYLAIEGSDKPRRQCEFSIVGATESGMEELPRKTRTEKEKRERRRRRRFVGEAEEEYERQRREGPCKK